MGCRRALPLGDLSKWLDQRPLRDVLHSLQRVSVTHGPAALSQELLLKAIGSLS